MGHWFIIYYHFLQSGMLCSLGVVGWLMTACWWLNLVCLES